MPISFGSVPPQVVNKERTGLAADVWSLGMVVWEIATGLDITAFPPLSVTAQVGSTVVVNNVFFIARRREMGPRHLFVRT